MTFGLLAYALFCFLVALLLDRLGIATTFVLASGAALGIQGALVAGRGFAARAASRPSEA
jgi:hypothetical protein